METNFNQYGLLELNNSRIMINKEMLDRLIKLAKKTIDSQGEQMCIFYGEELLSKVPDNSQTQTSSSRKVVCNIHTHLIS